MRWVERYVGQSQRARRPCGGVRLPGGTACRHRGRAGGNGGGVCQRGQGFGPFWAGDRPAPRRRHAWAAGADGCHGAGGLCGGGRGAGYRLAGRGACGGGARRASIACPHPPGDAGRGDAGCGTAGVAPGGGAAGCRRSLAGWPVRRAGARGRRAAACLEHRAHGRTGAGAGGAASTADCDPGRTATKYWVRRSPSTCRRPW